MILTLEQIRDISVPIAASYGVKKLSLFGSYARGEATEDSDVDLLVDRGGRVSGWAMGGLYIDLCEALGKELDLVTTGSQDHAFLERIRDDEVMLYEAG